MHALPRLLRPADLADALPWAVKAMSARNGRDHLTLAIEILTWAVQTCELPDARHETDTDNTVIIQLGEALVNLARSENLHGPGMRLTSWAANSQAVRRS